ncbi:MAG: M20 family metallopeptidase [Halobacteriaceae archaeon]
MTDVSDLARDLVAVPSHEDPARAGDRLVEWLDAETDATVRRDASGNVVARRGDGDRSLALVGHHDVVPPDPAQQTGDGYAVDVEDGRLYGRGSADMKGAVAAAACAFRDADPAGELVFASFVGEEDGGVGCRAAIDRGFAPDAAVVGEGTTGYSAPGVTDVAVAHKGRRGSTVEVAGEAAHAAEPSAGANAVYRACEVVERLRDLAADPPAVTVFGERAEGSLAVTGIDGGSAWNVVPERCTVTVDERTVPGKRLPLADAVGAVDGASLSVDQDLPPMRCAEEGFADAVLTAAADAQDGDPARVVKPHATDAGWLADAGTACVVCGPAEPGEAHTADESVSLSVLDRCYRIYCGVAERWPS